VDAVDSNLERDTGYPDCLIFLNSSRWMLGQYLEEGHYRFLPCIFKFIKQ
jgi:hypothetical protein